MMKRRKRFAGVSFAGALLVLLAGGACAAKPAGKDPFGSLSVDQVAEKVGKPNVYVFDNNPEAKFKSGHLPTAKWVAFDEVKASDLPADKAATLIFYCANERWHACHEAASSAVKLGYQNVFIMPAGIDGWKKSGKSVES